MGKASRLGIEKYFNMEVKVRNVPSLAVGAVIDRVVRLNSEQGKLTDITVIEQEYTSNYIIIFNYQVV